MPLQSRLSYCVDIVMCIDKTGSMAPILNEVKANALSFHKKFVNEMNSRGRSVEKLRVKVIAFGDYACDLKPMEISKFFSLPQEDSDFRDYVNGINAEGGGDEPENALEAIAHAIKSDWTQDGDFRRHVVVVFTDATAQELGERTDFSKDSEPMLMPVSLAELTDWWDEMESRAKRMVVFAPSGYPWDDLSVTWNDFIHVPSEGGCGLGDVDFDDTIRAESSICCSD